MIGHNSLKEGMLYRGYIVLQEKDTRHVLIKRRELTIAKMPCKRILDEEDLKIRVDCYIELLRICELIEEKRKKAQKDKARCRGKKKSGQVKAKETKLEKKSDSRSYFRM